LKKQFKAFATPGSMFSNAKTQELTVYLYKEGVSADEADRLVKKFTHMGKLAKIRTIPNKKRNKYAVYVSKSKIKWQR